MKKSDCLRYFWNFSDFQIFWQFLEIFGFFGNLRLFLDFLKIDFFGIVLLLDFFFDFFVFWDFFQFMDFFYLFFICFGFFFKLLRLLLKNTKITTGHQKLPKIGLNSTIRSFSLELWIVYAWEVFDWWTEALVDQLVEP